MTVRTRRRIARVCIAVSFLILVAIVAVPPLRHRAYVGGWGIAASSLISILAGLNYLRTSSRRRS